MFLEEFNQVPASIAIKLFDNTSQPIKLQTQLNPNIPHNIGQIAPKSLIERLLHIDPIPNRIKQLPFLSHLNQPQNNPSSRVEYHLAIVHIVSDGEGKVVHVHLQHEEGFVLGRGEVLGFEWG